CRAVAWRRRRGSRWAKGRVADSALYRKVFALAESATGKTLPRAVLPGITLESPKITRKLTTAWFAKRVDERYQRCMARVRKR
ncbi:DUF1615 family protein, partial [Pseudomonas aeruginosa]|uniref:DUF1615 family protein n=1 Tax=Pseudomonas aeruginosa TaxID=287 RepID=UPI003968AE11